MEIEELTIEEYLKYRSGFVKGTTTTLTLASVGIPITSIELVDELEWDPRGCHDGCQFTIKILENNPHFFNDVQHDPNIFEQIIKENFIDNVTYYNKQNNLNVPIARYKIINRKKYEKM